VIKTKICEVTDCLKAALSSGMTSLRIWLPQQEVFAGGAMKHCHCCIWYLGQALGHTEWKHKIQNIPDSQHWQYSSFTQQITLCFFYFFSGLWAFCQAVLVLIHIVATKIWSCLELDPLHIIHILGFIIPNFLPTCFMIVAALAIFEAQICMWVGIGKYLIFMQIRHMVRVFEF
jgi:hypothetical protein